MIIKHVSFIILNIFILKWEIEILEVRSIYSIERFDCKTISTDEVSKKFTILSTQEISSLQMETTFLNK